MRGATPLMHAAAVRSVDAVTSQLGAERSRIWVALGEKWRCLIGAPETGPDGEVPRAICTGRDLTACARAFEPPPGSPLFSFSNDSPLTHHGTLCTCHIDELLEFTTASSLRLIDGPSWTAVNLRQPKRHA